jgi:cell division protein FtsQ
MMPDDIRLASHETPAHLRLDPADVEPVQIDPAQGDTIDVDRVEVATSEPAQADASSATPVEPAAASPPHVASPARRRALMPWAVVGGILVVLGAGAIGLTYTPMFHAKIITVTGERRLSEERVLKIAGVGPDTDVFHVDLQAVERRLERNPWIADAVVSRQLPSSLSVLISERRPVALARSADGATVYLAVDGSVVGPARGNPRLPEVQTTVDASTDPSALATGAAVAQALPPALLPEVASIAVVADGSVLLQMRSGVTATYGDGSQPEAKGEALKAVLDYAANQGRVLLSVDVEVPGAPTAVFADTVATSP